MELATPAAEIISTPMNSQPSVSPGSETGVDPFTPAVDSSTGHKAAGKSTRTPPSPAVVASERNSFLKVFYRSPSCRTYRVWSNEEESNLIRGVAKLGIGNWEAIRVRPEFGLSQRSALQLKDKWRNLVKYGHVAVEDFTSSAAATSLPPTTPLKRKREVEAAAVSDRCAPCTPKNAEKRRSPSSSIDSLSPGTPSRTESSKIAVSSSDASFSFQPATPAFSEAEERVKRATDILLTAVDIQADANAALTDLLDALQSQRTQGQPNSEYEAAVRSATYVAELAREKANKARSFLEQVMRETSPCSGQSGLPDAFAQVVESEDTACSPSQLQLACTGEPSTNIGMPLFGHVNIGAYPQLPDDVGLDDLQSMLDNLQDDDILNLAYNGAADF